MSFKQQQIDKLNALFDKNICEYCGQDDAKAICSKCTACYYCSRECQKEDWKEHRKICHEIAAGKEELASLPDDLNFDELKEHFSGIVGEIAGFGDRHRQGHKENRKDRASILRIDDVDHGNFHQRRLFLKIALKQGKTIKLSENDLFFMPNATTSIEPPWARIFTPDFCDQRIESIWDEYARAVDGGKNFLLDDQTGDFTPLIDLVPGAELHTGYSLSRLSTHLMLLENGILPSKNHFVPKEVLDDNDDPDFKNRYWEEEIEPMIHYIYNSESWMVYGIKFDENGGEYDGAIGFANESVAKKENKANRRYASPTTIKLWQERLLHLLNRELCRPPVDAMDAFRLVKARASHEARFREMEKAVNRHGFKVQK